MSIFAETLAAVARELDLPPAAKARVLIELDADMDDYYEHCIARGMSPDEARAEVVSRLRPGSESLDALVSLHGSTRLAAMGILPRHAVEVGLAALIGFVAVAAATAGLGASPVTSVGIPPCVECRLNRSGFPSSVSTMPALILISSATPILEIVMSAS